MTGTKSYFSEHNEKIKGKVKFGDDSYVKIEGKGSTFFQRKTGEQNINNNIYHILELKNNILSFGKATEVGCDVRIRHDCLTVHDSSGKPLVKAI